MKQNFVKKNLLFGTFSMPKKQQRNRKLIYMYIMEASYFKRLNFHWLINKHGEKKLVMYI